MRILSVASATPKHLYHRIQSWLTHYYKISVFPQRLLISVLPVQIARPPPKKKKKEEEDNRTFSINNSRNCELT